MLLGRRRRPMGGWEVSWVEEVGGEVLVFMAGDGIFVSDGSRFDEIQ